MRVEALILEMIICGALALILVGLIGAVIEAIIRKQEEK